ncbi:MAG: dolichol kinase [Ignavibacteria bacterium]|nr:dolichol kinase [Ignavibacteria bacterium]
MTITDNGSINYRDEVIRKSIHLCSLSIPIIYYFIPRLTAVYILAAITAGALIMDIGRYLSPGFSKIFYSLFGFMLRKHELDTKKKNLNGATYVLLSALICVVAFPKILVLTAFPILIISDTSAALFGRKFGKHKFLAKSLEGTLAFFVSGVIVIFFTPKITHSVAEYAIAIVATFIAAIVENVSFGFADDNLSIPLSVGVSMWGMYALFLPQIDLLNSKF